MKFSFAWGPAAFAQPAVPGVIDEPYLLWRTPPATPSAVVSFSGDDQQHATAIFYRSSFRTTRGDTNGTTVAAVAKHWPDHGVIETFQPSTLFSEPATYRRMRVGHNYFFFDTRQRLVAVQVGEGSAATWMAQKR